MDTDTAVLAAAIGARVKRERRARDWTLDQLAAAAGVSRRMVVNVEQGAANPSVGTLLRLGDALGVGLPTLVEPVATSTMRLTRSGEGATLWTGEFGGRGVLVAGTASPDVVELWDWTLEPGDRHASETHAPGTRELVHVLTGELALEVGSERQILHAGDAIAFASDAPHAYANEGTGPARFSMAVHEPGIGTRPPHVPPQTEGSR